MPRAKITHIDSVHSLLICAYLVISLPANHTAIHQSIIECGLKTHPLTPLMRNVGKEGTDVTSDIKKRKMYNIKV